MSIKALSREERPRERLLEFGVESLTNVELLALILGKGSKSNSVLDVSRTICKEVDLQELPFLETSRLMQFSGIGFAKSCMIKAAIELGRRSYYKKPNPQSFITSPFDAFKLLQPHLQGNQEKFVVLFLNSRKQVLLKKMLFVGTINKQLISTREILEQALQVKATSVIISHNHPSGELSPSDADFIVTEKIVSALALCHISVDDHIIVSGDQFYSFLENGDL